MAITALNYSSGKVHGDCHGLDSDIQERAHQANPMAGRTGRRRRQVQDRGAVNHVQKGALKYIKTRGFVNYFCAH